MIPFLLVGAIVLLVAGVLGGTLSGVFSAVEWGLPRVLVAVFGMFLAACAYTVYFLLTGG